ncbi:MAG: RluA family pseudouridine synthase [Spirochaetales bacterium]|nr:RluA family pseudouridine synthase [Spirochaetales bacterium]
MSNPDNPIDIIYEDDFIMAVNKRPNIPVTPNQPGDKNLTDRLSTFLAERGDTYKAHPCHRLDKETSGVVLFAKGKKSQAAMMTLFAEREIEKYYIALVRGKMAKPDGDIKTPIGGKSAWTEYHVIDEREGYSIVHIRLHTGRTNQIRIHFASIGNPLLGETKYAFRRDFTVKFRRVALHCETISFRSPFTLEPLNITANLPDDLRLMIENVDK